MSSAPRSRTVLVAATVGIAVIVGGALVLADMNPSKPTPSLSDAQSLLTAAWKAGAERDRAGVCHYASAQANCRIQLDGADGVWPADEPRITCHRELAADGELSGGYALRVEGVSSNGAA